MVFGRSINLGFDKRITFVFDKKSFQYLYFDIRMFRQISRQYFNIDNLIGMFLAVFIRHLRLRNLLRYTPRYYHMLLHLSCCETTRATFTNRLILRRIF